MSEEASFRSFEGRTAMMDVLTIVLLALGYVLLMRYVFPRLGVPT